MNKEEILARSRKENDGSDERTQYIGLKGANFSISILVLLHGNAVSGIILCAYAVTVCVRGFCDISIIIIFVRGLISLCIGPAHKS